MTNRAAEVIASLDLVPHPEGGYFREILRERPEDAGRLRQHHPELENLL